MLSFPFDPIARADQVERMVLDGDRKRYYKFEYDAIYYNGIVSCRASGCCLSCAYCFNVTRNMNIDSCTDKFYSPNEVSEKVKALQEKHGVDQFRITSCEALLGKASTKHLGEVIRLSKSKAWIETNGIVIGHDPSLLDYIPKKDVTIRVTVKADGPQSFQHITGAKASAFKYQIEAIRVLIESKRPFVIAIMKQFVDIDKLARQFDEADIVFDSDPDLDIESLLYYPQNIQVMKDRGVKPLYRKVKIMSDGSRI